jgi:arsenite methyltransferase
MVNKNNSCCGENIEKNTKKELNKDTGCCEGANDKELDRKLENDTECGCGCGGEFPDESFVNNPENPKKIADADLIEDFEQFAHSMGIVSIGYAQIDSSWANTDEPLNYPNVIVLTLEMGKDIIEAPPGPKAQELNNNTYAKLGHITYALSDFIRAKGFATQVAHPYGGLVSFSPLGQEAGIGWIGKNGLLITPELGPGQKISAIFSSIENLPIKTSEDHSWIDEYCEKCSKCIKACPEKALIETEGCCGVKETNFIQNRCIGCSEGCTYCIEGCPFDQKGYEHIKIRIDKMKTKLQERQKDKIKT